MNYFKDYYARWEFIGYHDTPIYSEFAKLSSEGKKNLAFTRINNLKVTLDSLCKHEIFIPEKLYINGKINHIDTKNNNKHFQSIFEIADKQGLKDPAFSLGGKTLIIDGDNCCYYSGIIRVIFDYLHDAIIIESMSDIWQPMDMHGEDLNIERALVNSNRLEKCLLEIKEEGVFNKIVPDEGEDEQEVCDQYGFRMYFDEKSFREFYPDIDINDFNMFIWERRK